MRLASPSLTGVSLPLRRPTPCSRVAQPSSKAGTRTPPGPAVSLRPQDRIGPPAAPGRLLPTRCASAFRLPEPQAGDPGSFGGGRTPRGPDPRRQGDPVAQARFDEHDRAPPARFVQREGRLAGPAALIPTPGRLPANR